MSHREKTGTWLDGNATAMDQSAGRRNILYEDNRLHCSFSLEECRVSSFAASVFSCADQVCVLSFALCWTGLGVSNQTRQDFDDTDECAFKSCKNETNFRRLFQEFDDPLN